MILRRALFQKRGRAPQSRALRTPPLTAAILAALGLVAACGPSMQPVKLSVKGNLPDASVTVDDVFLGSLNYVSKHGVALPPGKHRITVERVGYFPWDKLVEAAEQPIVLDIQLTPIPD